MNTGGRNRAASAVASVVSWVDSAAAGDHGAISRVLTAIRPIVVRYCRARMGRTEGTFASADDVAQEVCLTVLTGLPSYRDHGRPFLAFVYDIAAHTVAAALRPTARSRMEYRDERVEKRDMPAEDPPHRVLPSEEMRPAGQSASPQPGGDGIAAWLKQSPSPPVTPRRQSDKHARNPQARAIPQHSDGSDMAARPAGTEPAHPRVGQDTRADLTQRWTDLMAVLPDNQREIVLLRVVVGLSAEETAEAVGATPGAVRAAQHRAVACLRQGLSAEKRVDKHRLQRIPAAGTTDDDTAAS